MARPRKRTIALALVLAALLAFLLPPLVNVNRFRGRIARSMEQALGRKVSVGGVSLRLLPRPGFDLRNLVIADDPAFGAEPMLRADQVTATFRLASLWRGRLEVSSLNLKSGADINPPSLNLVRAADGRWNVGSLLQRASQTPSAPTAKLHAEVRPRFPYIEANGGRINFKLGQEKKVYALNDADFALWLASEDEWAFRLAARPVRSDFNLGDTGTLKVSGRFRRAAQLRETPLELNLLWHNAQLGQITTLIYGRDRGWRGAMELSATMKGTPAALSISSELAVQELRRYDINTTEKLDLDAHCAAQYSTASDRLSDINCRAPMGAGVVRARGWVLGSLQPRAYDLGLSAESVGVQTIVTVVRHAKKDLPADLAASGKLDATVTVRKAEQDTTALWSGGGQTSAVVLRSSVLSPELALPALSFALEGPGSENFSRAEQLKQNARRRMRSQPQPETLRAAIAPFHVALGGNAPADVTAWFARPGYEIAVQGDAKVPRLLQAGRAMGLRAPQYAAEGSARLDLKIAGRWSGFEPPQITGTAQLRNVSAPVRGFNQPLHVANANLSLTPDTTVLQNLAVHFPGSPVEFSAAIRLPRGCEKLPQCPVNFDVTTNELSVDELNRLLNPNLAQRPWYDVFGGKTQSLLAEVRASGRLNIGHLVLHSVTANRVTAAAELSPGKLTLSDIRAELLGGRLQGQWLVDFTGAAPAYSGTGAISGLAMAQLATLMKDNWAGGALDADFQIAFSGWTAAALADSAEGKARFTWRDGILQHVALDGHSSPLQFKRFSGEVAMHDGVVAVSESRMAASAGIYAVSGTASFRRQLGLKLRNGAQTYSISGPLDRPKVALAAAEQQAALKP